MTTDPKKTFVPILLVFIFITGFIFLTKAFLHTRGFNSEFLLYANAILLVISIGGFLLQRKGLQSPNPNVFVRSVYASMMFKMFITIIAVLIYVFLFRNKINKPGLFTAMGMYIVYTVVEVTTLMKVARKKNNA
jgi:Ca2+/Na+ antiporter